MYDYATSVNRIHGNLGQPKKGRSLLTRAFVRKAAQILCARFHADGTLLKMIPTHPYQLYKQLRKKGPILYQSHQWG